MKEIKPETLYKLVLAANIAAIISLVIGFIVFVVMLVKRYY